jgi:hypothetical protein
VAPPATGHGEVLPLLEPELELPDELPLEPLSVPSKALQKVEVPPLLAWHCQVHGPVPLTAVAVPDEQRLLVGALVRLWALDEPHMPLTAVPPLELDPEVEPEELASPDELEPEPEELEPPDETLPDDPEPEPEEPVLPDVLPDELEPELDEPASPDELLPEELEPEPEELASPDELLPDELEPELEPPPEPGSGRTQRELPLSHRRAATCVSLLCRLRLLTGIVPLRVTTDHTPLVSV